MNNDLECFVKFCQYLQIFYKSIEQNCRAIYFHHKNNKIWNIHLDCLKYLLSNF